jgi:hypothetical protein
VGQLAGVQFEALGCPADPRAILQERPDGLENLAKAVARHHDEDVADAIEALIEFDERL